MTRPAIYVGLTEEGEVEATFYPWYDRSSRVTIDRRTGDVTKSTVKPDSDEFRWLVQAARAALKTDGALL